MSTRKKITIGLALLLLASTIGAATFVWKTFISPPWEEEYAFTKGTQAAIYSFPYVLNSSLRWAWSQPSEAVNNDAVPSDAINHFFHSKHLTDARYRDGGSPNNDTAYSVSWAYVGDQPLIVRVPDVGTLPGTDKPRYYSFELAGFDSDNFAYIGTRTTGNQAGNFAIVPKGWQGALPEGVTRLAEAPTPWILILGRTLVLDQADMPAVQKIIQGYRLVSLSDWGSTVPKRPFAPKLEPVPHYKKEKLELLKQYWNIANRALSENPPSAAEQRLLTFFEDINVGPGRDVGSLSPQMQSGLQRASLRALLMLPNVLNGEYHVQRVNGWKYPPKNLGRSGVDGDYLTRAAQQSLGGIVANDPVEAVYLNTAHDGANRALNGKNAYRIRFEKGNSPPANAFWSLTLYDMSNNLAANSLDRYALGDRSQQLSYAEDGSLTLYISAEPPAAEHLSNWLPAPKDDFYLILRAYLPKAAIIEQTWQPPAVKRL